MKISYNEATAKDCSTLAQDLILCEEAGFDYIEIRIDMLKDYLKNHSVEDLKAFFSAHKLKPHAFNAIYIYPEFLSENDDEEKCKALMEEFYLCCNTGREIGSEYIIVVPPLQRDPKGGPYVGNSEDTFNNCVRILRELSSLAEEYGMKLCFEPVGFDRSSVRTVKHANEIVTAVDRDNVGFVFDSYNLYLYGGSNDFSDILLVDKNKIFAVHINNADSVPPEEMGQDKRRFCDSGVVDLGNYLNILKKAGYEGMVSIEVFRPEYWAMDPRWVINEAYRTTKNVLEKYGCVN